MIDKKLLLITALLLASCTSDPMTDATDGGSQIPATSHKIVNTSIDAEAGSLLVYFDDAAIGSLEQAAEAAERTHNALGKGAFYHRLHQLDRFVACGNVNAGSLVAFRTAYTHS